MLWEHSTLEKGIKMKHFNPETKTFKVFQALRSGEALTASKASKMGVKNLSAEVSRIRSNGFAVYTNSRVAGNGVKVTEYVLGKPSRKLVALGYKAQAMGITL
jgi:Helix-turn-helix domain